MKRRDPNTFEDALMRIAGELTAEGAGAVIHKGKGRIYAAADRDRDNFAPLNVEQCLALDVAFNDATGQGFPMLEAYERQAQARSPHRPMDAAHRITSAAITKCAKTALRRAGFTRAQSSTAGVSAKLTPAPSPARTAPARPCGGRGCDAVRASFP